MYGAEQTGASPQSTESAPTVDFSSQMQRAKVAGIELIAIDMPIKGVVSFVGSFAAGETLSPVDSPTLAGLTAAMLDQGTQRNDRFAIAERLDALGAGIGFAAGAHSLGFSGKFLRADAGAVMDLLAEQLREPAFDPAVLETLKSRHTAGLLQAIDNPDYRADAQISRMLYPEGHPNYSHPIDVLLEDLKTTSVEDLRQFHSRHYGPKSMTLVFAGDIDFEQLTAAVEFAFEGWTGGVDYPKAVPPQLANKQQSKRIYIADKTSVAVRYGQNTGIQRTDPDYLPFMVGNYILGGSFNSRLMQQVRKQQGLTYNIRSSHVGDILTPGNWSLRASFSPSLLDQGLDASQAVFAEWYQQGVSTDEVRQAIDTLAGSYVVGLSTTSRVASQVLSFMQRGFAPEYIDQYPRQLQTVTAEQVNRSIQQYLNPDQNTLVVAGSFAAREDDEATARQQQMVSIRLDTPDAGWRIEIEKVYRTTEDLIVISRLQHSAAPSAAEISTVSDKISIPAFDQQLAVRHYVLGKTWEWGSSPDYNFIESSAAITSKLEAAELLYSK